MSKRRLAARLLRASGTGALLKQLRVWRGLLVFNYHRIGEAGDTPFDRNLWSASEEVFDAQVRLFRDAFDVIGPADLDRVRGDARGRYLQITFDDGYRDNYSRAFRVLSANRVPATFFIATGYIDKPRLPWWDEIAWMVRSSQQPGLKQIDGVGPLEWIGADRESAVRRLISKYVRLPSAQTDEFLDEVGRATGTGRYRGTETQDMWMDWDMLREMKAAGMWIGGHTVTHPVLARASREQQFAEISGCDARIRAELGGPMTVFSYPIGAPDAFNGDTRACLQEAGVQYAYSYYGGFQASGAWDPYDLKRMPIEPYVSLDEVAAAIALPQMFSSFRPLLPRLSLGPRTRA
jgi:peptidoglycan/xylan/chitin deacetylase (PgdA/CDA1 family)